MSPPCQFNRCEVNCEVELENKGENERERVFRLLVLSLRMLDRVRFVQQGRDNRSLLAVIRNQQVVGSNPIPGSFFSIGYLSPLTYYPP
jgi:hypothetical protein